ncbi:MAG: hypothetical protein K6B43_10030 [Treponema sp.]|nr:hypothetical protein [Treponema sp.]
MKKRTLLGLCLSIFSLFLFSCGIAESNDGSATLNVDTATIVQRSIKSASFELSEDEIFEKYAESLNYELTAIVHYEIDGKSENKTFSLWKINGKEAMELVNELESMSGEKQEEYFTDKFKSQTLTIENLPVGKTATFKMKIRQKIGFDVDLSQYEGLSESEISKDEYLAISKEPVTATIGTDSEITIKLTEYSSSLDWEKDSSKADEPKTDDEEETTPVPWTVTGTLPNEYDDSLEITFGVLSIFKKVGNTWNLLQIDAMPNTNGFTLDGNTLSGSGIIDFISEGDTVVMTIILTQAELADGTAEAENVFVGRSKEITITKDSNIFNLGELKYEEQSTGYPAPDNTVATVTIKSTNAIDAKYAVIAVQTENGSTIFEEPFKPNVSSNEKYNYIGEYSFSGISAFADLADGTELSATLTLYRDAPQGEVIGSYKISHTFYTKIINEFDYHDEDATDTGTSDTTDTTSSGKAGTYWDNSNGLPEPVLFVNYNGTEYKSTDSANALTVTADGKSITFANKYLGNDDEWHYYAGMIFDCEYNDTAIPTDAVKWYLNDSQIFQAQVDGTITLTIGTIDYNNGGTGVGAAELKTGENTIKVEATYNGNTKSTTMTFTVQEQ